MPYFSSDKAELTGKKRRKNLQFRAAAYFFCIGEIFMKKTEMLHKYLVSWNSADGSYKFVISVTKPESFVTRPLL